MYVSLRRLRFENVWSKEYESDEEVNLGFEG